MTNQKSDRSDPRGENKTPQARGGVLVEDRAKDLETEPSGGPFAAQEEGQEGKAAAEEKMSGKQKRQDP